MTSTQQDTLKNYLSERNSENWGLWPDVQSWPIPAECGAWTASQYETRRGRFATVVKFDQPVVLADGTKARRVGVGAIRGLGFCVASLSGEKEITK